MRIKKHVIANIRSDKDIIKELAPKLDITPKQVKDLLLRYAFNRLVLIDDATTINEIADVIKYKYMENENE